MMTLLLRLKRFCGTLFGMVFFLSGLVKIMDPVGAGLVMKEYYDFLHIGFLEPTAEFFGVTLALAETVVGAALVCGVWKKVIGRIAIVMQGIFTVLTLFLYIFNPEMDCGCFGEAIHLTHFQTFVKNIILLTLILLYYFPSRHLGQTRRRRYVSFGIVSLSSVAFMVYSLLYIPLIDFTAYKPGAQLLATSSTGGDDIYEAVFTYEKDGQTQVFTREELTEDLNSWTFVSTDTRLKDGLKENDVALSIFDSRTQTYVDSLAASGKVLVISLYDVDISKERWAEIEKVSDDSQKCGIRPLILSTENSDIPESLQDISYTGDYKTIISLNRSNGGITYFNDGTLTKKWARRNTPSLDEVMKISKDDPTETAIDYESKGSLGFQGFLLYVFAVLLLL